MPKLPPPVVYTSPQAKHIVMRAIETGDLEELAKLVSVLDRDQSEGGYVVENPPWVDPGSSKAYLGGRVVAKE